MRHHIAAMLVATLITGSAIAQTPSAMSTAKPMAKASSTTKPARPITKNANAPVVRTAKSLDCSKQADTKGLHGQPRKAFMSSCKKA